MNTLRKKVSISQELACDRRVISQGFDRVVLAEALCKCTSIMQPLRVGFANQTNLMIRIRAIERFRE